MTSHYLVVPDESRGRQAFGEAISHNFVCAQRHEFEEAIQYEFTHIVLMNVNMKGELSAHRIFNEIGRSTELVYQSGCFGKKHPEQLGSWSGSS